MDFAWQRDIQTQRYPLPGAIFSFACPSQQSGVFGFHRFLRWRPQSELAQEYRGRCVAYAVILLEVLGNHHTPLIQQVRAGVRDTERRAIFGNRFVQDAIASRLTAYPTIVEKCDSLKCFRMTSGGLEISK
jgi:hypothetical protein